MIYFYKYGFTRENIYKLNLKLSSNTYRYYTNSRLFSEADLDCIENVASTVVPQLLDIEISVDMFRNVACSTNICE